MRNLISLIACLCLVTAPAAELSAQYSASSGNMQRAKHAELVDGDLETALAMYDHVILSRSSTRPEIASAIQEKARIAEMKGDAAEAWGLYEKLVAEYGDQPKIFLEAQRRLAENHQALPSVSRPVATDYRLVMAELSPFSEANPRHFDFSPEGNRLAYLAPATPSRKESRPHLFSEIYIQDLESGTAPRPLLEETGNTEFFGQPRWSPDARYIFYVALDADGVWSHWIRNLHSGTSDRMEIDPPLQSERGVTWFGDSRHLILAKYQQINIYDLRGRVVKTVPVETFTWHSQLGNISADGNRVLVSLSRGEGIEDFDIWSLDLDTEELTQITDRIGFDRWPIWGPDGESVIFASDRSGTFNVFEWRPTGEISQITSYKNANTFYPTLVNGRDLSFVLARDDHSVLLAENRDFANARMLARGHLPTVTAAGDAVYYLSQEDGQATLRFLALDTGVSRILMTGEITASYGPMNWVSPDGTRIAVFVREGNESVMYVIPGDGGPPSRLFATEYPSTSVPAWSPDGNELLFADGPQLKVISADGGRPEVIGEGVEDWEYGVLRWSPDGTRVAAFANVEGELENVLMIANRKTHEVRRITPPEEDAYKEYLDWHPSGQSISYMTYHGRYKDGSRKVDLATGEINTIAQMPDPMWDYFGTWGPDGNFYFTSGVRGSWIQNGLYVYRGDGSIDPVRVPRGKTITVPSWSNDGDVATWHETEHRRQLWMISDF